MGFLKDLFGPSEAEVWTQFAAQVGGRFIGGGILHSDRVVAPVGPWTITLDLYSEPVGRAAVTYTRLRAPYVNEDGFRFTVYRKSLFSELAKHLGMQDIVVGDPAFDDPFIVKANDEAKIRDLLADPALRESLEREPTLYVEVKDQEDRLHADLPDGVDELYLQVSGVIKEIPHLTSLYELFTRMLDHLRHIGSAGENGMSGVSLA